MEEWTTQASPIAHTWCGTNKKAYTVPTNTTHPTDGAGVDQCCHGNGLLLPVALTSVNKFNFNLRVEHVSCINTIVPNSGDI